MKLFSKITAAASLLALTATMLLSFGGVAHAACFQYAGDNTVTSDTPVFNNICNVPSGVGNESDFVRIRPSNGDSSSTANNGAYTDSLASACTSDSLYDVRTYIHNDATPTQNGNGSGSAVAHNVQLAMTAPLNSTSKNFTFGSTVSASNAASVHDTATLNCNGEQVKLTLVPSSVKIYGTQYTWQSLGDGAVNGTTRIGSPTMGSGDVWGCWDYRVVVAYTVKVQKEQIPQQTAKCDLFTITASDDRKIKVSQFKYTAENAVFKQAVINWGDNSSKTITDANGVVGQEHQYSSNGKYVISLIVSFTANGKEITSGGAGTACIQQVTFSPNQPPSVTPPTTPGETPTSLVNTGPGSAVAAFAAATAAGTFLYRRFLTRRLGEQ